MGKRFTATEKWDDAWFRKLPAMLKLGWNYLTDKCDAAGVIELDRELAEFQIGGAVDWDELVKRSDGRIQELERGKLWLSGFIGFQYQELSRECRAHRPIFASIEKHGLAGRSIKPFANPLQRVQEQDTDKETETEKEKEGGAGETKRRRQPFVPPTAEQVTAYCQERSATLVDPEDFVDFYVSKGWKVGDQPMKDWKSAVRRWQRTGGNRGSPKNHSNAHAQEYNPADAGKTNVF